MTQRLKKYLSKRRRRHIVDASREPAAVLVPIYFKEGEYYILFIKRTENVKTHKGQIAFPGGVYEAKDRTLISTALRESAEEIGLMAEDVEVLGGLDDEVSLTSNYIISPFVGFIPWPYRLKADEKETEEIIEVPISALLDKSCLYPDIQNGEVVDAYHYQERIIWGATARILDKFLDIFAQLAPDK